MRTSRHSRLSGTSLSRQERVWDVYEGSESYGNQGVWFLSQRGSLRRPQEFSSRQEAESRQSELNALQR